MAKKIRELKALLLKSGFTYKSGKGSHSKWEHSLLDRPIIIARKDGADAPRYLERQVMDALKELKEPEDG
jgi:predicted RNA binding protein YcfA (HicA-like mRNA interferase family)